jgi:plasmid stability protein
MLHTDAVLERTMDLSIKGVPEDQVRRLRERAKANHRSLQGELRALIDQATGTPRLLTVDEVVAKVSSLGLVRRDEAARLIREDRDRYGRRRVRDCRIAV